MFVFSLNFLYLASAIQLFYSVRNMFELYCNVVPTYHQQHLVSKIVSAWPQIQHSWHFIDRITVAVVKCCTTGCLNNLKGARSGYFR